MCHVDSTAPFWQCEECGYDMCVPCADRLRPPSRPSPSSGADADSGASSDPHQAVSLTNKTKKRMGKGGSSVCCVSVTAEAPLVVGVVTSVVVIDAKGQGLGQGAGRAQGAGVGVGVVVRWTGEEEENTYPVKVVKTAAPTKTTADNAVTTVGGDPTNVDAGSAAGGGGGGGGGAGMATPDGQDQWTIDCEVQGQGLDR